MTMCSLLFKKTEAVDPGHGNMQRHEQAVMILSFKLKGG